MKKILVLCLGLILVLAAGCKPQVELPPTPEPPTSPVGQAIVNIDTTAPNSNVIIIPPSVNLPSEGTAPFTLQIRDESIIYNKGYILKSALNNGTGQWSEFTIPAGTYQRVKNARGATFIAGDISFSASIPSIIVPLTLNGNEFSAGDQNAVIIFSCDKLITGWDCHSTGSNWLAKGFTITRPTSGIDLQLTNFTISNSNPGVGDLIIVSATLTRSAATEVPARIPVIASSANVRFTFADSASKIRCVGISPASIDCSPVANPYVDANTYIGNTVTRYVKYSNLGIGQNIIKVSADLPINRVIESNESNNEVQQTIYVRSGLPEEPTAPPGTTPTTPPGYLEPFMANGSQ